VIAVSMLPAHPPGELDSAHVLLTGGLFILNLLFTAFITKRSFVGRLRYVGHEMVFLSLGLISARIFLRPDYLVWGLTLFLYIIVWVVTLLFTKQVMDRDDKLYPQVVFSLVVGCFSVLFAADGYVEQTIIPTLLRR
jgi:hypothetical protein